MEMCTDLQKSIDDEKKKLKRPPSGEPTITIKDDYVPAEAEADRQRRTSDESDLGAYQARHLNGSSTPQMDVLMQMITSNQKLIDKEEKKLKRLRSGEPTITIKDDYVPVEEEADRQQRTSDESDPGAKRQKLDDESELSIINPDDEMPPVIDDSPSSPPHETGEDGKQETKLKIIYTNANGITGKINSLQATINENDCNICCITETKLKGLPPILENHTWETRNRTNKQGGGVATIISKNLTKCTKRIENLEHADMEIMWIEVKTCSKDKIHIGTYYGKQENTQADTVEREMNELKVQINRLKEQGGIILTGDFNAKIGINQPKCTQKTSRNGKFLENLINETGLIPISTNASRGIWTRQNRTKHSEKSVIDYILVDENTLKQMEEIIVDEEGTHRMCGKKESDHNTMLLTINICQQRDMDHMEQNEPQSKSVVDCILVDENTLIKQMGRNNGG